MSRMILSLLTLVILSGCQCCECPRYVSLVAARLETLGPDIRVLHPVGPNCCDNCAPHPTLKHKYEPWWDDFVTQHTAERCAFRALCTYQKESGRPVSHHFKMGFICAYEDLALNRKPLPPIVPPPKYWNAFYRSCAGRKYVDDWYAGYDAGLDSGSNSGVSRFHEIYLRRNRCNTGWINGYGNAPVNLQAYGQPDPTNGVQEPVSPTAQPNPVAPPNTYGSGNPYGVTNFHGVPDAYGVQAP